jgi:Protein of unknown function (DUF2867)
MTKVREVSIPSASSIHRALKQVHFSDAYEAQLNQPTIDAQGANAAVFSPTPGWILFLLRLRGVFANIAGLKHPQITEVGAVEAGAGRRPYAVGDRVGLFPVQSITAKEIILGIDDKHLNFRVSVLRSVKNSLEYVTISTVVELNNSLGRSYLFAIKPFHRLIVRSMLQNALKYGRI